MMSAIATKSLRSGTRIRVEENRFSCLRNAEAGSAGAVSVLRRPELRPWVPLVPAEENNEDVMIFNPLLGENRINNL
jgi:hypothetical protein